MSGNADQPSPFWTFSLSIYGREGVPPACLALQGGSGVDVNVLLFSLYLASVGRRVSLHDLSAVVASTDDWKTRVVAPLRGVRTFLKDMTGIVDAKGAQSLRNRVKAVELEAERLQQEALFSQFPATALGVVETPTSAARNNVAAYEGALGARFDTAAVAKLLTAFDQGIG